MLESTADFKPVPTRAALALQKTNQKTEFQALVFEEPKSATKEHHGQQSHLIKANGISESMRHREEEFDIRKVRNEIVNFAMNNQRVIKNQRKLKILHAIKLGAKPPKKNCINYKELQAQRKRLVQIREERKKCHRLGKTQTGAALVKCRSKTKAQKQQKKRTPVTAIAEHYGVVNPKLKKKK